MLYTVEHDVGVPRGRIVGCEAARVAVLHPRPWPVGHEKEMEKVGLAPPTTGPRHATLPVPNDDTGSGTARGAATEKVHP